MIRRTIEIISSSFIMALQELWKNKLRTFLSLFGITIGIFCIIGVLATVDSLEKKIKGDLKSFDTNTIYVDKWEYGGGSDYRWWKFIKRPIPKFREVPEIKIRSQLASAVIFTLRNSASLEHADNLLTGISIYGASEDFDNVITVEVVYGRYLSDAEFNQGAPAAV